MAFTDNTHTLNKTMADVEMAPAAAAPATIDVEHAPAAAAPATTDAEMYELVTDGSV